MELIVTIPDGHVLVGTRTEGNTVIVVIEQEGRQPIGFRTEPLLTDEDGEYEEDEGQATLFDTDNGQEQQEQ